MRPFALLAVALLIGCSSSPNAQSPSVAGRRINATAPAGIGASYLGRPHDAHFLQLQGEEGRTLFPDAGQIRRAPVNEMRHEYVLVESEETLAANFGGWGITASADGASSTRHASYRAMQIAYVEEIDDTSEMEDPPAGSVYYPARIYYGHSYEVVVSGIERQFHTGVKAQLLAWGGEVKAFAQSHKLTTKAVGRGLRPRNGGAIFAKTAEDIEKAYVADGPAVPIIIEYRQLPNTRGLDRAIAWPQPLDVEFQVAKLRVGNDGTWGDTPWELSLNCKAGDDLLEIDPFVWRGVTGNGGSYDVNKPWHLALFPGDQLHCEVNGSYSGPIAGHRELPAARMVNPVVVGASTNVPGVMTGKDQAAAYDIEYTVRVVH